MNFTHHQCDYSPGVASYVLLLYGQLMYDNDDGDNIGHATSLCLFCCTRFQYILQAATSPATLLNEETQTYLNQGISTSQQSVKPVTHLSTLMADIWADIGGDDVAVGLECWPVYRGLYTYNVVVGAWG